ncbi:MAG: hypothetical protein KY475_08205, partial [Planctomycetes bacterium]|nr:hypothetical protein [Planctomycetota bacterium]
KEAVERGEALRVTDDGTEIVLVRADVYDRLAKLLYDAGDWSLEEMSRLAWEAGKSIGWDDPAMDLYDDYEKHRP